MESPSSKPAALVSGSYDVSFAIAVFNSLYALMKVLILVLTVEISFDTDRLVEPIFATLMVTPSIALSMLFELLVMEMPLTLSWVFCAALFCFRFCTPEGSYASRDANALSAG
ncbi:hypothetical protein D3C87_1176580 [compost metagenome]